MLMQLINVTKQECKQNHDTVKSVYYTIVFLVDTRNYFNSSYRMVYVKEVQVIIEKFLNISFTSHSLPANDF